MICYTLWLDTAIAASEVQQKSNIEIIFLNFFSYQKLTYMYKIIWHMLPNINGIFDNYFFLDVIAAKS